MLYLLIKIRPSNKLAYGNGKNLFTELKTHCQDAHWLLNLFFYSFISRRLVFRHRRSAHRRGLRGRPQQTQDRFPLRQVDRVSLLRQHRSRRRVLRRQVGQDGRGRDEPSEASAPHHRRHPELQSSLAGTNTIKTFFVETEAKLIPNCSTIVNYDSGFV